MIKVFHVGDIHIAPNLMDEVERCFTAAIDDAIEARCDVAVLAGDTFDHQFPMSHPALQFALESVSRLADAMPVLIIQGTYSHDPGCAIDTFKTIRGRHEVIVVRHAGQVGLVRRDGGTLGWRHFNDGYLNASERNAAKTVALFSCLPSFNKADIGDAKAAGEHTFQILKGFAPHNLAARQAGIATIGVSHGTVSGCHTEHGVAMHGLDHEFTEGTLFAAECSAFMLAHVHAHQAWERDGRLIAYCGSVGTFTHGQIGRKGALHWTVTPTGASFVRAPTPASEFVGITFDGEPETDALEELRLTVSQRIGQDTPPVMVRIRYVVDEERAGLIDRKGIEQMFLDAGAAACKVEAIVNPVTRTRSSGITQHVTTAEKLAVYCESTGLEASALLDRLHLLETAPSVEAIVDRAEPAQEEAA